MPTRFCPLFPPKSRAVTQSWRTLAGIVRRRKRGPKSAVATTQESTEKKECDTKHVAGARTGNMGRRHLCSPRWPVIFGNSSLSAPTIASVVTSDLKMRLAKRMPAPNFLKKLWPIQSAPTNL
jgi:hypothetical protein